MNRVDRLSAILVLLQSRQLVKSKDIANRFDISQRTVYRDIRALEEAGIPIIGNPGVGYSLVQGFKLPPLMFTSGEAIAFLMAGKLVGDLNDAESVSYYKSGLDKIRAVMQYADKDTLEAVENNLGILETHKTESYRSNYLQTILQSTQQKKVLQITYFSDHKQETSQREIEPIGIFFSKANWYLIAFCKKCSDYRNFRVDRIRHITELDVVYSRKHPPLNAFLENANKNRELHKIVISVPENIMSVVGDDKYLYGLVETKQIETNRVELTFLNYSLDKFAHWYLSFADCAQIISPEALKNTLRAIIKNIDI